jgi:hypothetical protein
MSGFEYAMGLVSAPIIYGQSCSAAGERRLDHCGNLARWSPADA